MDYLKNETQFNIDNGNIVSLKRLNTILFSYKNEWIVDRLTLLNSDLIKLINNNYYVTVNKISAYLNLIKSQKIELYFPYNYYKYFDTNNENEFDSNNKKYFDTNNKKHIDSNNKKHFDSNNKNEFGDIINTIDKYLNYLDSIGNQFSNLIKHILYNGSLLNAEFVDSHNDMICIKFNRKVGKSLFILLSSENQMIPTLLCYSEKQDKEQFNRLYEIHKNLLIMDKPEDFLISNLEKVTGNLEFSEMAVKSYLLKNDFQTSIKSLCNLISWKNEQMMKEFIDFFVNKYILIVKNIDGEYMTNFEGINKFLLSLDVKYLQQWSNKEQINELYYQITHELIRSYEILYNHNNMLK